MTYNWGSIDWVLVNRLGPALPHLHIEDGFGPEETDGNCGGGYGCAVLLCPGARPTQSLPSRRLEKIARTEWKLPSARLHYIPNGIDCQRFAKPQRAQAQDAIVIGTVATLRREKNIAAAARSICCGSRRPQRGRSGC